MAKKLKKNTSIAKAKSLKTNVTRKFKGGGPSNFNVQNLIDPEKPTAMQPIGMKPIPTSTAPVELEAQYKQYPYQNPGKTQFFPSHYLANKDAYDKADSQGRTMGIDWYEKRKQLPQFKDASESFIKTFKEGAPAYYFPDEAYEKTKTFKNSVAMALMPYYPTENDNLVTTPDSQPTFQDKVNAILKNNPNASYKYTGRQDRVRNERGEKDNLYGNSVNYKGHSGAEPFTTFEELNHVASNTAGGTNTGHKENMEKLGQIVNAETMLNAGYTDIPDYKSYANYASGDAEEFFTSLQTARQSLGLDPLKEDYTEDQMLELLEKKRAEGEAGLLNKESAESDQMSRFYRTIGWPTKNSKYLNGKTPSELTGDELDQYNQAKKDAAKRFLQSHNSVAENEGGNTEDYGLPQAARYGGYKYEKGDPEDPEDPKKPWRHKIKSEDGNYLYNRVGTNAIQDYDKSTVRRTLKGFITGAPKPKETIPRTSDAKFAEGGMNKNMFNANSTTGPRSEHSWQDPGVNRFSGNTNGVNADYYFKKGGLKSKVSSKFAKLKL